MKRLPIHWARQEPPREPVAVLASGLAARGLAGAALERTRSGSQLRVAFSADTFLVLGVAANLPWIDGAVYLGREDGLLVPTTSTPSLPADMLRSALARMYPDVEYAVVPGRLYTFPTPALEPDPSWLASYAAAGA